MSRVQAWILLATLLAFLAGGSVGYLAAGVLGEASPLSRPYANYEKRLSEELRLDAGERERLRGFLLWVQGKEEEVKNRQARHMEEDMSRCTREVDQAMQEFVSDLTKDQQLRYEQLLHERN